MGIDTIDATGLTIAEATPPDGPVATLDERVAGLDGRRFHFDRGSNFAAGAEEALREHAVALLELRREAAAAGKTLAITLTGSTDSLGTAAMNVELAKQRAAAGAAVLAAAGLETRSARLSVIPDSISETIADADKRHVQIDLDLQPLRQ